MTYPFYPSLTTVFLGISILPRLVIITRKKVQAAGQHRSGCIDPPPLAFRLFESLNIQNRSGAISPTFLVLRGQHTLTLR